jgi:uncharacterized repeat protein (TIGR03803 family)
MELRARGAFDKGTVLKLDKTGKETVLYNFTGGKDGAFPYVRLFRDGSGNLYGTTGGGGALGKGTVFKLDATQARRRSCYIVSRAAETGDIW